MARAMTLDPAAEDASLDLLFDADDDLLYPDTNDPLFALKITRKREFHNAQIRDPRASADQTFEELANERCSAPFEILPNQLFVRTFLSPRTPYNSLLLYGELGTGKTCSAIGVTEQVRAMNKQSGHAAADAGDADGGSGSGPGSGVRRRKIIVVASPNVQDNFRLQLFDANRMVEVGGPGSGHWTINSCAGSAILAEINPAGEQLDRAQIKTRADHLIAGAYEFVGYTALALRIVDISGIPDLIGKRRLDRLEIQRLRRAFDGRLIVIDEVHNIIGRDTNASGRLSGADTKKISALIYKLVKHCSVKLLFLSATPMYNNNREIVWLANLMSVNDRRPVIRVDQVFAADGTFREPQIDPATQAVLVEGGRDLLARKLSGYVSYVRGENPFAFPFRVYPDMFAPDRVVSADRYPRLQLNGRAITDPIRQVKVYTNGIGSYQRRAYEAMIESVRATASSRDFEEQEAFGYITLQGPIGMLNMVYPSEAFDAAVSGADASVSSSSTSGSLASSTGSTASAAAGIAPSILKAMIGTAGLDRVMEYDKDTRAMTITNFRYRASTLERYGPIFRPGEIEKYSAKLAGICDIVRRSTGLVLIYSKFIDGGLVPMALSLESMGFARHCTARPAGASLLAPVPGQEIPPMDVRTMRPKADAKGRAKDKGAAAAAAPFAQAKYIMITGNKYYSPDNAADLAVLNSRDNLRGEAVKCALFSDAGAEGLDFARSRQVHCIDPWYNMNHIEQVIGRGVRNLSHCTLPLNERNVEIYLHGTLLPDSEQEAADMYLYRLAERKAVLQGAVTRLLKEISVDCLLNIRQLNYTTEWMNQVLRITLSTDRKEIDFPVGDKPGSSICDYMSTCEYVCRVPAPVSAMHPDSRALLEAMVPDDSTYDYHTLRINHARIAKRVRELFRDQAFYTLPQLVAEINLRTTYPIDQIYFTLLTFLRNRAEWIVHRGRRGFMVHKSGSGGADGGADDIYLFQPVDLTDDRASIFDRTAPVFSRRDHLPILVTDPEEEAGDSAMGVPPAGEKAFVPSFVPSSTQAAVVQPTRVPSVVQPPQTSMSMQASMQASKQASMPSRAPPLSADDLAAQLDAHLAAIFSRAEFVPPSRTDTNWFSFAKLAVRVAEADYGVPANSLRRFVVDRFIDSLALAPKLALLNQAGALASASSRYACGPAVRDYFARRTFRHQSSAQEGIVLADTVAAEGADTGTAAVGSSLGNNHVFVRPVGGAGGAVPWSEIPLEEAGFVPDIQAELDRLAAANQTLVADMNRTKVGKEDEYNIGYIGLFRQSTVLRSKNLRLSRINTGAVLDQAQKKQVIAKIQLLLRQTGRPVPPADRITQFRGIDVDKFVLCAIYELLLRHFTPDSLESTTGQTSALRFLTREQAIACSIDQFLVKEQTIYGKTEFVFAGKEKGKAAAKRGRK